LFKVKILTEILDFFVRFKKDLLSTYADNKILAEKEFFVI